MTISQSCTMEEIKDLFDSKYHDFQMHLNEVYDRITLDASYVSCSPAIPYAKRRIKQWDSLQKKINNSTRKIDKENMLREIGDIAGIRILILHRSQMQQIDSVIRRNISTGR